MDETSRMDCHGYMLHYVTFTGNHGHRQPHILSFVSAHTVDHISWLIRF